jgi:hypothetical protein
VWEPSIVVNEQSGKQRCESRERIFQYDKVTGLQVKTRGAVNYYVTGQPDEVQHFTSSLRSNHYFSTLFHFLETFPFIHIIIHNAHSSQYRATFIALLRNVMTNAIRPT